jgi:hypothetical protein
MTIVLYMYTYNFAVLSVFSTFNPDKVRLKSSEVRYKGAFLLLSRGLTSVSSPVW